MTPKTDDYAFPSWCECEVQEQDITPTVIVEAPPRRTEGGRHRPENIEATWATRSPMTWQEKGRLIVEAVYIAGAVAIVAVVGAMIIVGAVWG